MQGVTLCREPLPSCCAASFMRRSFCQSGKQQGHASGKMPDTDAMQTLAASGKRRIRSRTCTEIDHAGLG